MISNIGILIMILFMSLCGNAQSFLLVKKENSSKEKQLLPGKKIKYQIYSDSLIGVKNNWENDQIQSLTDNSLVFSSGEEIMISDIKVLAFHSPVIEHWKIASVPLLIFGSPNFLYGLTKGILEGMERDNEQDVPIYTISGGVMVLFGVIPYMFNSKEYSIEEGYQFHVQ
jgi:hypothetical protein